MNVDTARVSRIGDRERNEDYQDVKAFEHGLVAVVCDGLGGHAHGDLAARAFAEAVLEYCTENETTLIRRRVAEREDARALLEAVFVAGREGLKTALEEHAAGADIGRNPQTTAVVAVLRADAVLVGHLGDSRAYLLADGEVCWRTRDHSVVQMLVDQGEVREEDMGGHPDQGKLFKSVGVERDQKPSVALRKPLKPGNALLLCSDGLWEQASRDELAGLAQAAGMQRALEELAEEAEKRAEGDSDNVSAICIRRPALAWKDRVKDRVRGLFKAWFSSGGD